MGEFVEGFETLAKTGPAVSVFGSARIKPGHPYYDACVELGRRLAIAGYTVITGGGPGLMEATNKGAYEIDPCKSIGCGIELPFEQGLNPYCSVGIEYRYFFVRKVMFVKYSQAFVCAPGGAGTMDEFAEIWTLVQTKKVKNFPIILYVSEFWSGFLDWLQNTVLAEGMISPEDLQSMIRVTDSPEEVVRIIQESETGY